MHPKTPSVTITKHAIERARHSHSKGLRRMSDFDVRAAIQNATNAALVLSDHYYQKDKDGRPEKLWAPTITLGKEKVVAVVLESDEAFHGTHVVVSIIPTHFVPKSLATGRWSRTLDTLGQPTSLADSLRAPLQEALNQHEESMAKRKRKGEDRYGFAKGDHVKKIKKYGDGQVTEYHGEIVTIGARGYEVKFFDESPASTNPAWLTRDQVKMVKTADEIREEKLAAVRESERKEAERVQQAASNVVPIKKAKAKAKAVPKAMPKKAPKDRDLAEWTKLRDEAQAKLEAAVGAYNTAEVEALKRAEAVAEAEATLAAAKEDLADSKEAERLALAALADAKVAAEAARTSLEEVEGMRPEPKEVLKPVPWDKQNLYVPADAHEKVRQLNAQPGLAVLRLFLEHPKRRMTLDDLALALPKLNETDRKNLSAWMNNLANKGLLIRHKRGIYQLHDFISEADREAMMPLTVAELAKHEAKQA